MRRKPLFPPPTQTIIDPLTRQPTAKRQKNKGRQKTHVLTINGRIALFRRWWHSQADGSSAPSDRLVNRAAHTVTGGVIEMAARLNNEGNSFASAADNLVRTAQVKMSGEQLRQLVIAAGKEVIDAQRKDEIPTAFQANDCPADPADPAGQSRIYLGVDGVMVPAITDAEKIKRRNTIKRKRQRSGKKCKPLPPRRRGTDEAFKEFKTIVFYDESAENWHERLTRSRWPPDSDYLLGDSDYELNPSCHATIEAEANYAAGQLLFLKDRFVEEAMSSELSFKNVKKLQRTFKNSLTSTLWRYVEEYRGEDALVGIVSGHPEHPGDDFDPAAPCRYTVQSQLFRQQFSGVSEEQLFAAISSYCWSHKKSGPLGEGEVRLFDDNGEAHLFHFETFKGYYVMTLGRYMRKASRKSA